MTTTARQTAQEAAGSILTPKPRMGATAAQRRSWRILRGHAAFSGLWVEIESAPPLRMIGP